MDKKYRILEEKMRFGGSNYYVQETTLVVIWSNVFTQQGVGIPSGTLKDAKKDLKMHMEYLVNNANGKFNSVIHSVD